MADTPRRSPTLRRRRLSAELRRLRAAAGMTAIDVTNGLGWASGKLTRMERGEWVRPNPRDVEDLLGVYGVTDADHRAQLVLWAREGRERGWWHPYREMLSESYTTFLGLEQEVSTERVFELAVIPGILQTDDYARALMARGPAELSEQEIENRVTIRMRRQELLTGENPVRLWVVMDEAALRRSAGGEEVMQGQLAHLIEMSRLPKVTIQVIPFSAGTHSGTQGPFTILEFPKREDPDSVYVETVAGELFVEEPEEVDRFKIAFDRLVATAGSPDDTTTMIQQSLNGD